VEVQYDDIELKKLANGAKHSSKLAPAIVKAFRKRMQLILAAVDERDFYALKSLHYEKLQGERSHQRSMRLNKKMRLILEIEDSQPKNIIHVISIEDYH